MEAFACGLPVIASRLGAMAALIRDGESGLLFEPGNPADLAEKVAWAQAHPDAMRAMGEAARREYVAKYTPAVNYRQLLAQVGEECAGGGVESSMPRRRRSRPAVQSRAWTGVGRAGDRGGILPTVPTSDVESPPPPFFKGELVHHDFAN